MKGKITIFAFLGFIIFFLSMEAKAVDWVFCAKSKEGLYYYDPQGIKQASKDIVQAWTKLVYTEKSVQEHIKKLGPAYNELSYAIALGEFNCSEKKYRFLSITEYNQGGGVIASVTNNFSTWHFVVPHSVNERLFNIVCGGR
jgi:hypothetical protein